MGAGVQFRAMDHEQKEDATDSILLAAVMESCVEGLAIVEGGVVLRANRAFAHTFGYFEGRMSRVKPWQVLFPRACFCLPSTQNPRWRRPIPRPRNALE